MRVLFVNHVNYLQSPLPEGIALLSSLLKQNGHEVELFDTAFLKPLAYHDQKNRKKESAGVSFYKNTPYSISDLVKDDPVVDIGERFVAVIDRFKPELIAVSAMTTNYEQSLDIIRQAKARYGQSIPVIFGGVHPTLMPEEVIKEDAVDYVCIGEGEEPLLELCRSLDNHEDVCGIKNLYVKIKKKNRQEIFRNDLRMFVDLNSVPVPDFSIFDQRYFFKPFQGNIYKGIFLCTSRGCPRGCAYCVNNKLNKLFKDCGKKNIRFQSPEIIAEHIRYIQKNYDVNWIRFSDDTFLMRPLRELRELSGLLKPLQIMFGCAVDPVTVTEEKVKVVKEMGCVSMSIGIETGNETIRRRVLGRHISNEQIRRAIRIVSDHGIKISAFNMIGLPGETSENVFETIRLNKELGIPDANMYILYPFPGTEIYNESNVSLAHEGRIPPMEDACNFNLSRIPKEDLLYFSRTFNLYLVLPENYWKRIESAKDNQQEYEELVRIAQDMMDNKKTP